MSSQQIAASDDAALAEAARWFVLLASGEATEADRARWLAWRGADTRHEASWQRTEKASRLFAAIPQPQARLSFETLERRPPLGRMRRRLLGSLALLLGGGLLGWQGWRNGDWSADQRTAVGERRDIVLADGSQLQLDTDSAVDIEFSSRARLIRLRHGRLLVATAAQPQAAPPPFLVETADGRVQALGTRFSVHRDRGAEATQVVVLEARVAIRPDAVPDDTSILPAGQAARFNRHGLLEQRPGRAADAAWAKGLLVADDLPLADFIAELGRYHAQALVCAPAASQLRISGTYPLSDPERVLLALTETLPIRLQPVREEAPEYGLIIVPAK